MKSDKDPRASTAPRQLRLFAYGLAAWCVLLTTLILVTQSYPTPHSSQYRCPVIFGSVFFLIVWAAVCFRKIIEDWQRRHRKRSWLLLGGLLVYEAFFGAWAWHFAHSPHPIYPDPRAIQIVVAGIGVTVMFFVVWTLFCVRFRRHET